MERGYFKGKGKWEVNKKGKYKQEKKEASYKKQKEASGNGNKHTNNLYSAKIYFQGALGSSAHTGSHQHPITQFLWAGCSSCNPINWINAPKAKQNCQKIATKFNTFAIN